MWAAGPVLGGSSSRGKLRVRHLVCGPTAGTSHVSRLYVQVDCSGKNWPPDKATNRPRQTVHNTSKGADVRLQKRPSARKAAIAEASTAKRGRPSFRHGNWCSPRGCGAPRLAGEEDGRVRWWRETNPTRELQSWLLPGRRLWPNQLSMYCAYLHCFVWVAWP